MILNIIITGSLLSFLSFLIIAIVFLAYMYFQQKNKISQLEKERTKLLKELAKKKSSNSIIVGESTLVNNSIKKDKQNKEDKINEEISDSTIEIYKETKNTENSNNQVEAESEPVFKSEELFFESYEDGYFLNEHRKKEMGNWDVYKIKVTSEKEGILELLRHNEEELISNRDVYLINSICEVSFVSGGKRNKIKEVSPGKVQKEDDRWIVKEKIKVIII